MTYSIQVNIPDELLAAAQVLGQKGVSAFVEEMGLQLVKVAPMTEAEKAGDLPVSPQELRAAALKACETVAGKQAVKTILQNHGALKLSQVKESDINEVYNEILAINA